MKLTKSKIIFGAVALIILTAIGIKRVKGQEMGVELNGSYVSDYIRRGVSKADDSVQARINVTLPIECKFLDVTNLYGKFLLNRPLDGSSTTRDVYVGTVFGTSLVQVDLGARYLSVFDGMDSSELYGGLKLDVIGNPGVYVCNAEDPDFTSVELRVSESLTWGFLPEKVSNNVRGRVGKRDAPVDTTFYEVGTEVGYKLSDSTTAFAGIAYGGTTTDVYDDVVSYTVGVRASF
jgi:hypothetical protein